MPNKTRIKRMAAKRRKMIENKIAAIKKQNKPVDMTLDEMRLAIIGLQDEVKTLKRLVTNKTKTK